MPRSKRRGAAVMLALGAALTFALPTVAAAPTPVTITSPMHFNDKDFNTGTFTAEGPAVDAGLHLRVRHRQRHSPDLRRLPERPRRPDPGSEDVHLRRRCPVLRQDPGSPRLRDLDGDVQLGHPRRNGRVRAPPGQRQRATIGDSSDPQTGNINTYTGFVLN